MVLQTVWTNARQQLEAMEGVTPSEGDTSIYAEDETSSSRKMPSTSRHHNQSMADESMDCDNTMDETTCNITAGDANPGGGNETSLMGDTIDDDGKNYSHNNVHYGSRVWGFKFGYCLVQVCQVQSSFSSSL